MDSSWLFIRTKSVEGLLLENWQIFMKISKTASKTESLSMDKYVNPQGII